VRFVLACAALCLLAPAASAKTYGGMAAAGTAISGDSVVWGAEYRDGGGAVKVDGRVVTRFERAQGKRRSRSFTGVPGAVSASPTRLVDTLNLVAVQGDPAGGVALTDRWAAWSVKRATYDEPAGPGNVFLKTL
jgi:hypothetical protein